VTDPNPVPPPFRVVVSDRGRALVITLSGEVDLLTAPQVAEAFDRDRRDHELVVLDLREVSFMDSMGVRMAMSMKLRTEGDGCALVLAAAEDAPARRIIRVAQLEDVFRWVRDPGEALAAARG
jgi:anti-sigma B factor antagonist